MTKHLFSVVAFLWILLRVHSFLGRSRITSTQPCRSLLKMLTVEQEIVMIPTSTGPMRTQIMRPHAKGKYPGIVFYSEIFQLTGPILRTAQALAGHGFVVAIPEIYHATSTGWVGEYTTAGADDGNRLKVSTPVESHDDDSAAVLTYLRSHPACTGKLGTAGFCIGGHLSLRAGMVNDGVHAVAAWYPTDMHTGDGVCAGLVDQTKDTFNMWEKFRSNNNGNQPSHTQLLILPNTHSLNTL